MGAVSKAPRNLPPSKRRLKDFYSHSITVTRASERYGKGLAYRQGFAVEGKRGSSLEMSVLFSCKW